MTKIVPKLCALAAAAALTVGSAGIAGAQNAPSSAQMAAPPAAANQPAGYPEEEGENAAENNAAGPAGATRPIEVPVLYVTSIEVLRGSAEPKIDIVRVTGLASSDGWSAPELVPFFYGRPADDVLDLQFVAQSPEQSQKADGFMPVSAIFPLDIGHTFKGVRVRAAANALQLMQLPGVTQTTIKALSGKDLIGKKFVENGPGGPGVVTAAELPRGFRTIAPTHGVGGIIHDPNRLDLILDDSNRIVMAFWE